MNSVVAFLVVLILYLAPISESAAKKRINYSNSYSYNQPTYIIYWRGSTFYQHPNGIVYARHYNKEVIDDLLDMNIRKRIRHFYVMPKGYPGAIPLQWKKYMYRSFADSGIQISVYKPVFAQNYQYRRNNQHYDNASRFHFEFRF